MKLDRIYLANTDPVALFKKEDGLWVAAVDGVWIEGEWESRKKARIAVNKYLKDRHERRTEYQL